MFAQRDEKDPRIRENWINALSQVVIAVAAVLTLMSNRGNLPEWFAYLPYILLVLLSLFLVIAYRRKVALWWKKKTIARSTYAKLIALAKEFRDLTSLRMNDTITYAMGEIANRTGTNYQNREFAELCEWTINNLIQRLEGSEHGFNEFQFAVRELHALIHSYHRTYLIEGIRRLRVLGVPNIDQNEQRIIEVARENFSQYLGKFRSFYEEINERLKVRLFEYYFEKAQPL